MTDNIVTLRRGDKTYTYQRVSAGEVPPDLWWHTPGANQGQAVERSYSAPAGKPSGESGPGAPFMRETDTSLSPWAKTFYRLVAEVMGSRRIEVNLYTGRWDAASRREVPDVGTEIRLHGSADAREYDGLRRKLREAGRDIEYVRDDGSTYDLWVVMAREELGE